MNTLGTQFDYRSLSVSDLLEARDLYHAHLINKENVVGTAIGLYLIRDDDPWPDREQPTVRRVNAVKEARTLERSEVRPYSWPCVLAFVSSWVEADRFGGDIDAQDMVPKTLYLPDGRMVPVCVVKVEAGVPASDPR